MESLSGKDFLETCKHLDIDTGHLTSESVDWIFYKSETKYFLYWLCSYINENNIETGFEICAHENLQKKGAIFSGENLDNKVHNIENSHAGIFEIDSSDIAKLQRQIDIAEEKEKTLDKLTSKYVALDHKINHKLSQLGNEKINKQVKKDAAINNCVSKSKELDAIYEEIQTNMKNCSNILLNYFHPAKGETDFISQMCVDNYKRQEEGFQTYLNLWIEKEFNVDETTKSVETTKSECQRKSDIIGKEFIRIGSDVQDSVFNRVMAECCEVEMESRLEYLKNNYKLQILETDKRVKTIQVNGRIKSLLDEFTRLCVTELQQAAERFTQGLIDSVLSNYAMRKLNKCRALLKKLKCLNCEVNRALAQKCVTAMLFKVEKLQLEAAMKFLSRTHFHLTKHQQESLQRSQLMSGVESEYLIYKEAPIEERNKLVSSTVAFITGEHTNDAVSIDKARRMMLRQRTTIENLEQELFVDQHRKHQNDVNKIECKVEEMKEFMWCGPTMQPVVIPYELLENTFETQSYLEKFSSSLNKFMQTYKETEKTLSTNRWLREKCSLYVWFLMEPEKVTSAIKQIKTHVEGQLESNKSDDVR